MFGSELPAMMRRCRVESRSKQHRILLYCETDRALLPAGVACFIYFRLTERQRWCWWRLFVFKRSPSTQKCRENCFLLLNYIFLLLLLFGCSLRLVFGFPERFCAGRMKVFYWWWFSRCHKLQSNARRENEKANRFFFFRSSVLFRTSCIWDIAFLFSELTPTIISKRFQRNTDCHWQAFFFCCTCFLVLCGSVYSRWRHHSCHCVHIDSIVIIRP